MPEGKAKRAADVLLGLLERQRQLYRGLQDLADRQAELVTAGSPDGLLEVLAQRQRLLEEVRKSNDALLPFRQRWDAVCRLLSETQRAQASAAIAEINERLQHIMRRDQADSELLQLRCRKIGEQLQAGRVGREALRAYGEAPDPACKLNEAVE